jgi:hypothetical protein
MGIFGGLFGSQVGHKPLFDDLCQYHALDKKTRTLLNAVIQKYQSENPAEIFVDPALLNRALIDPDFEESVGDLKKICNSWFGTVFK